MWIEITLTVLAAMTVSGVILAVIQQVGLRQKEGRLKGFSESTASIFFIMALVGLVAYSYSIATYQPTFTKQIPTSGILVQTPDGEPVEIECYWDVLGEHPVQLIEWGEFNQQESRSKDIWIRNEGYYNAYLTVNTTDEYPDNFNQHMRFFWDFASLEQWTQVIGEWSITNGSTFAPYNLYISSEGGRSRLLANDDLRFNYEITTRVQATAPTDSPEMQIIFRYRDGQNHYFAGIGAWGYKAAIGKFEDGAVTRIAEGGNPGYADIVIGQWYNLKVRVIGSTFSVYVDDELICTVDDTTHGFGRWGLTTLQTDTVYDWVELRDPFTEDLLFADYFTGPPIKVGMSRLVKFNVENYLCPPADEFVDDSWNFGFNIVITAWDEKPTV